MYCPTTSIKPKSTLDSTRASVAVACEENLCSKYVCHMLVVSWRSNVNDAESSLAVRSHTTSVRIPETLGGYDRVAGEATLQG